MSIPALHFLLKAHSNSRNHRGHWQFVLQTTDGQKCCEAKAAEPAVQGERLELLAVVRGLEALDQPSRVTVLTNSAYVSRGFSYGFDDWRSNNWQWERHGAMVPIKNGDLWRRLDRALRYHQVNCRHLRVDPSHSAPIHNYKAATAGSAGIGRAAPPLLQTAGPTRRRILPAIRHWLSELLSSIRLRMAQLGTDWLPKPWLE